jgi:hypothetical protein
MGEGIKTMSTGAMNPVTKNSGKVKTPEENSDWVKMTGVFSPCRRCRYRRGENCLYDGECEAVEERAEVAAEAEANAAEIWIGGEQ